MRPSLLFFHWCHAKFLFHLIDLFLHLTTPKIKGAGRLHVPSAHILTVKPCPVVPSCPFWPCPFVTWPCPHPPPSSQPVFLDLGHVPLESLAVCATRPPGPYSSTCSTLGCEHSCLCLHPAVAAVSILLLSYLPSPSSAIVTLTPSIQCGWSVKIVYRAKARLP